MNSANQAVPARGTLGRLSFMLARRILYSIRLTGIGLGAIFFLLLIGAAAINTGTNLLYLMMATILAFHAMSLIFCRANLARLQVRRCLPSEVFAGQACLYEIEIANRKRLFASYGICSEESPKGPATARLASFHAAALPLKSSRHGMTAVFPRRGWVDFDEVTLFSSFPFGFFEARAIWSVPERLLVYPELIPVAPLLRRQRLDAGELESRMKGQGSGLYAIRDYIDGDPARSIHWKLSARSGSIKVREFEREEARRIRIILDAKLASAPTERDLEEFERSISMAASLAKHFIERGHETALWSPAGSIPSGSGERQLRKILRALAEADADAFRSTGRRLAPPPTTAFTDVVISDHSAPPAEPGKV